MSTFFSDMSISIFYKMPPGLMKARKIETYKGLRLKKVKKKSQKLLIEDL